MSTTDVKAALLAYPRSTARSLSEQSGISLDLVKVGLGKLKRDGEAKMVGKEKGGAYVYEVCA